MRKRHRARIPVRNAVHPALRNSGRHGLQISQARRTPVESPTPPPPASSERGDLRRAQNSAPRSTLGNGATQSPTRHAQSSAHASATALKLENAGKLRRLYKPEPPRARRAI